MSHYLFFPRCLKRLLSSRLVFSFFFPSSFLSFFCPLPFPSSTPNATSTPGPPRGRRKNWRQVVIDDGIHSENQQGRSGRDRNGGDGARASVAARDSVDVVGKSGAPISSGSSIVDGTPLVLDTSQRPPVHGHGKAIEANCCRPGERRYRAQVCIVFFVLSEWSKEGKKATLSLAATTRGSPQVFFFFFLLVSTDRVVSFC